MPDKKQADDLKARIREVIQEAWCENPGVGQDTFGNFLDRAAKAVFGLIRQEIEKMENPENPEPGEFMTNSVRRRQRAYERHRDYILKLLE